MTVRRILFFQNKFNIQYQCFFVSFEKFVLDEAYRSNLFFKVFGFEIVSEVSKRFVPKKSMKNTKPGDDNIYLLSNNIDLRDLQNKFDLMENL